MVIEAWSRQHMLARVVCFRLRSNCFLLKKKGEVVRSEVRSAVQERWNFACFSPLSPRGYCISHTLQQIPENSLVSVYEQIFCVLKLCRIGSVGDQQWTPLASQAVLIFFSFPVAKLNAFLFREVRPFGPQGWTNSKYTIYSFIVP
jgi:hypothetical protein